MEEKYFLCSYVREERGWCIVSTPRGGIYSYNNVALEIFRILSKTPCTLSDMVSLFGLSKESDICKLKTFLESLIRDEVIDIYDGNKLEGKFWKIEGDGGNEQFLNRPLSAIVNITNKCNQKCEFCYIDPQYSNDLNHELSFDELLDICEKLVKARVYTINFLGGEPLARLDELLQLVEFVNERAPWCHCTFATNGTYNGGISAKQAKLLSKCKNLSIRVSVNGYGKAHDIISGVDCAYDMAIESIKNLIKYAPNIEISVSTVMTKLLSDNYELFIREIFSLGINVIEFSPLQYSGRAISEYDQLKLDKSMDRSLMERFNEIRSFWLKKGKVVFYGGRYNSKMPMISLKNKYISCGISTTLIVDVNGDAYFCHMSVGNKSFCPGNILESSVAELWNSKTHLMLIERQQNIMDKECFSCPSYAKCQGGCLMERILGKKEYMGKDPTCPYNE